MEKGYELQERPSSKGSSSNENIIPPIHNNTYMNPPRLISNDTSTDFSSPMISPLPTAGNVFKEKQLAIDVGSDDEEEDASLQRGKAAEHESLLRGGTERESLGITNLDVFFQQVYLYFYEKGFWCLLLDRILRLITLLFMVAFSTFLFVFLNWEEIWRCQDVSCKYVPIIRKDIWVFNAFHIIVFLFELTVLGYWFYSLFKYLRDIFSMITIKHFYNNDLNISEIDIQTIQWVDVVERMIELQKKRKIYIIKNVDEFDIMNRILRKEHYLISFINKEVMDLFVPLPFMSKKTYLSETLLFNLRLITDNLFDSEFKINEVFIKNPGKLRSYFIKLGLVNLLMSPFLFIYILMYTSFKYLAELKNNPKQILGRRWSIYSKFKFRQYQELDHEFEKRMNQAYYPAMDYLNQFPIVILSILAKRVMFIASAFAGVIIVLSYLNNSLALYFSLFNQNLLTWLTTLLFVWAYAKSYVIDEHAIFSPKEKLDNVCEILHYHDPEWKGKGQFTEVRDKFTQYYINSYEYFLNELLSVFVTPLILLISLPRSADRIMKFVDLVTVDYEGIGHICGHAAFKFNKFGNRMYGSVIQTDTQNPSSVPEDLLVSENGKMEMSYLNFLQRYPKYKPKEESGAKEFLENINQSLQTPTLNFIAPNTATLTPREQIVLDQSTSPTRNINNKPSAITPTLLFEKTSPLERKKKQQDTRNAFNQMLTSVNHFHQPMLDTQSTTTNTLQPILLDSVMDASSQMLHSKQLFRLLESHYGMMGSHQKR
ncbi:hypothetical protein ABK040_005141 [Willaertia magna]